MRILYIFNDYMGRRRRYGKMMNRLGHKVSYLPLSKHRTGNHINRRHAVKYNPDIVWLQNAHYIRSGAVSSGALNYWKSKGIPIVVYGTFDVGVPYTKQLHVWKQIDFFFVHHKAFCKYLTDNGVNAFYMPTAFYPDIFKVQSRRNSIPVTFCGRRQTLRTVNRDKRVRYLKAVCPYGLRVYGRGFKGLLECKVNSIRSHEDHMKIYSLSKVNLDLPFINSVHSLYKHTYHLKNRFFEIPATGGFMLTTRWDDFLEIFDETMVGYHDDDPESLRQELKRYQNDKSLRKKMAKRATKHVCENHTFLHRFKEMFAIIDS